MPTLYCDQNVLITALDNEGFPPNGPFGRLLKSGRVDFVFSTTHLIEAARMRTLQEATNMARLLDHAGRFWLPDRISLELDEIRHVLDEGQAPQALVRTVTEVTAKLNPQQQHAPHVVTALTLVQGWRARPELLEPMVQSHKQNVQAFRANVRDTKRRGKGNLQHIADADVMRIVVRSLAARYNIQLDPCKLAALDVEMLPTNHTELVLSRLRWMHGGNFRWQTFMDGEHLIAAMPHVDVYMTFDLRKRNQARTLRRQCSSCRAEVVGSFQSAELALQLV